MRDSLLRRYRKATWVAFVTVSRGPRLGDVCDRGHIRGASRRQRNGGRDSVSQEK